MDVAPLAMITPKESESFIIKQDDNKYILKLINEEDYIIFNVLEKNNFPNINYIKKLSFKEIKELHKIFYVINFQII